MGALKAPLLLGLGLLLLASSSPRSPPSPSARPKPSPTPAPDECPPDSARVVLLGDSLAVGLKAPLAEHATRCGTDFVTRAFVGAHVTEWDGRAPRLGQVLDANQPTHVLISLGGNDFQRNDPENVAAGINRLIATLKGRGIVPLWIEPPEFPFADELGVRDMWHQLLGDEDIFDARTLWLPRAPDNVHPTPAGYETLADALWAWLSARLHR